jgi:putative PEP-CTERM system TPR-repeat lipoprotein
MCFSDHAKYQCKDAMLTHAMNHSGQPRGYPWMQILAMLFCATLLGACGNSVSDLIRSAEELRGKGDHAAAIIQLKNVLGQEPNHLEGNILIGLSYAETGEAVDAERKLRRAVELGSPHARVLPALGQVLIETEQYKEAVSELRKAKDVSGEALAQISLQLGHAQTELKQYAEARTQYLLAGTVQPTDAKLGLARVAAAENERKTAYQLIDEVLASAPKHVDAWVAKGDLLRGDAKQEEALKAYQQATALNPNHVVARVSLATAYMNLGKNAEARAELAQVQKYAPAKITLRFAYASLALRERKFEECTDNLAAIFRVIPRHMPSLLLKGAMHFANNELQQAELAFAAYLTLQPGHIYARKMLAAVLLRKEQAQSAAFLLEPMISQLDGDAELFALAGEAYMQLGQTRRAKEYYEKSVALEPDNASNRIKLGVAQIRTGNAQKGVAELESAISLNPGESRADHTLIMLLITQSEIDKALQAVQALEKRRPDKADTHFLKGAVYRAKQDWAAARASFEQALKIEPKSFAAAASLAQIDMKDKKPEAARARMENMLKVDPRNLDAKLLLATMEFDSGRQKEGIEWLRKAVADHSNSMLPFAVLAEALLKAGQHGDALTAAQKARELAPKESRVAELLGDINKAMGKKEAAITNYANAVQLQPTAIALQIKLAEAFASNGNLREANNIVRRTQQAFPQSIAAKSALAENLILSKNYTEAIELAKQIQRQSPKTAVGFILEGEIGMSQRDYARAAAAFEQANALEAKGLIRVRLHQARNFLAGGSASDIGVREWLKANPDDLTTRFYLAELERKAGRNKAAIEHYQTILKTSPRHLGALNNLALALHQEGDPKAADYAIQAFQMKPDDARLADTAGWILVSQGKLLEGLPALTKAASLDSENPEIRFHLAQAYEKAGDTARARSELKTVIASGKKFPQLEEARALLNRLGQ